MINSTWLQLLLLSQWALGVIVEWLLIALAAVWLSRLSARAVAAPWRARRRRTAARLDASTTTEQPPAAHR